MRYNTSRLNYFGFYLAYFARSNLIISYVTASPYDVLNKRADICYIFHAFHVLQLSKREKHFPRKRLGVL